MSNKFRDFLNEQLQDSEFKAEYDALEPEFTIIQAMIDARKQLSEKTGIAQFSRRFGHEVTA
ncbi:MAG: hypothetical protein IJ576_08370 [Synergistaceae bacterium]|nr:hypothetical protein [Synergistaceae bacterium]